MSKSSIKVEITECKLDETTKLRGDALKRHLEFGADSLFSGLDMKTFNGNLNDGMDKWSDAKKSHGQAELLNQHAGLSLGLCRSQNAKSQSIVYFTLTSTRNILLGLNRSQKNKFTEWGLTLLSAM